eukprot:GHVL01003371.1.p1 GENE.GHVL01003371.1~~GHVL01003371.1.p1  ORF type:complete len:151 (-),score=11.32 GHVL01003371.1:534-986(-)
MAKAGSLCLLGAFALFAHIKENSARTCVSFEADVIFLLDASDDVGIQTFQSMKKFMGNFVQLTEDKIDPIQVRLTAVTFASEARVEFSLTDCPFSDDLLGAGQPRLQELEDPKGCIGNIRSVFSGFILGRASASRAKTFGSPSQIWPDIS